MQHHHNSRGSFFHTLRSKGTAATTSPSDIFIDSATGMFIPLYVFFFVVVVFLPLMTGLCVHSLSTWDFYMSKSRKNIKGIRSHSCSQQDLQCLYFLSPVIRVQRQMHTSVQAFQWSLLWIFGPHSYQDMLFSGQMLRNQWLRKVLQFPEKSLMSAETIRGFCSCSWMLISNIHNNEDLLSAPLCSKRMT